MQELHNLNLKQTKHHRIGSEVQTDRRIQGSTEIPFSDKEDVSSDLFPDMPFSKEYFQLSAKCKYINIYS